MKFLMGQWINPRRFVNATNKTKTDVLHYSNFNHLTYPCWKGLRDKHRTIQACTAHDIKRRVSILNRKWENHQLRQFYRGCDLIFVHSQSQKQELESFSGPLLSKIVVVPHGPYAFCGSNSSTKKERILPNPNSSNGLFFGNIRDEKNLEELLRAIALCEEDVHLTVAGKSGISGHKSIQHYRNLAVSLGIENKIKWLDGHVPEDQVGHLFQSSDWIALPYKDQFTSQSGVFNIATHYSKPMLITPAPTFKEIFTNYLIGELAKNDSPKEINEALRRLVKGVRKGIYDGFKSYQANHTWEGNAELTLKAYQSALTF